MPASHRPTRASILFLTLLATNNSVAQDEEGFSGRVALGYLATRGNTENQSVNLDFDLWWNYEKWKHAMTGQFIKASSSSVTIAEASALKWKSDYAISANSYVFGRVAWTEDEFSSYPRQVTETLGYGRRFIDREKHILNADVGLGARQADLRDGTDQDEGIVLLAGDYRWIISEGSEFTQTLSIESGSDNTFLEAKTRLSATVFTNLALVLSYTIRKNSDVLPGTEKTDTFTAISLEYAF